MVQGLCKTPSHREQGSCTCQTLQLCSLEELPRPCRDPKKRHPQNSLGCKIINTSPAHAHCNLRVAPGHHRAHCACAVRLSLRAQDRKEGSRGPTKKKRMGLRRPLTPRFLVSYLVVLHGSLTLQLLLLLPLLPSCATRRTEPLTRSLLPRETNSGSASVPPLPAAHALPANQRSRRPP